MTTSECFAQSLVDKLNQGSTPTDVRSDINTWNQGRRSPQDLSKGIIDPTKAVGYVSQGGLTESGRVPERYYRVYVAQASGLVGITELSSWQYYEGLASERWKKSAFMNKEEK
ncbi:MAG: hypothetical protein AABX70_06520 [Nanoarchaeota archaeon]